MIEVKFNSLEMVLELGITVTQSVSQSRFSSVYHAFIIYWVHYIYSIYCIYLTYITYIMCIIYIKYITHIIYI